MRGQLSAEMLILLALILGLIFIVYTQLNKSVVKASSAVDSQTNNLLNATGDCSSGAVCPSGYTCDPASSRCVVTSTS